MIRPLRPALVPSKVSSVAPSRVTAPPVPVEAPLRAATPGKPVPRYAGASGAFVRAASAAVAQLTATYLASLARGLHRAPEGDVSRVDASDLAVDLEAMSPAREQALLEKGRVQLRTAHYFTSGAGLWSRGGGQVKALIPFNLRELMSPADMNALFAADDLVNAKTPSDVLLMAGVNVPAGEALEDVAARVTTEAKATIEALLAPARRDPRALPPLALKLVQTALASRQAGGYVSFDVWTSEQTHGPITDYLAAFKTNYPSMQFHPDAKVQREIVSALREYFDTAASLGDTHVFGVQKGFHALDPETGAPIPGTPLIGEGAGRAKAYLDESGRTSELARRGKKVWMFENIEVVSDLQLLMGAHAESEAPVSVVVVPQKQGYAGGNPFKITRPDGSTSLELHEQSALPAEFREGNAFFNTNSLIQPLDAAPPSILGFEVKNNGTQVRAKQNAGDITQELRTAGIGGRIGQEYENFKTYREYFANGVSLIDTCRAVWSRD